MNPNDTPTYDPVAVMPLRAELNLVGFKDVYESADVDEALSSEAQHWLWSILSVDALRAQHDLESVRHSKMRSSQIASSPFLQVRTKQL